MEKIVDKELFASIKAGQKQLSELTPLQRSAQEKSWDVEHAYYSSTLEGSNLDRKEFESLAEGVK